MRIDRLPLLFAGVATFALATSSAAAGTWHAKWRGTYSSTKVFMAAPNAPLCRWTPDLVTTSTPYHYDPASFFTGTAGQANGSWQCGGKTSGFGYLDAKDAQGRDRYATVTYSSTSDWHPADTVIDEQADKGLCLANVAGQWVGGYIARGDNRCETKVLGKTQRASSFKFIVLEQNSITQENKWVTKKDTPLFTSVLVGQDDSQNHLHKNAYLCSATYQSKTWFGTTFVGQPPTGGSGSFCKIVYRPSSSSGASYKYVSSYSVYLNNKPSKEDAVAFGGSTFNGNILAPQPNTAMCRKGNVLGMKYTGENTCRYAESTSSTATLRYLFTRK